MRVEQELARRARKFLGDEVAFCVYDRSKNQFLTIDDQTSSEILEGRLQINFEPERDAASTPRGPSAMQKLRVQIRRAMRTNVTLYRAFQHLRGRPYTRDEILQIQREEFHASEQTAVPVKRVASLSRVSCGTGELSLHTAGLPSAALTDSSRAASMARS